MLLTAPHSQAMPWATVQCPDLCHAGCAGLSGCGGQRRGMLTPPSAVGWALGLPALPHPLGLPGFLQRSPVSAAWPQK